LPAWNRYKDGKSKHNLFKAVIYAYRKEHCIAIFWSIIVTALQLVSPFILRELIVLIQDPESEIYAALTLVAALVIS